MEKLVLKLKHFLSDAFGEPLVIRVRTPKIRTLTRVVFFTWNQFIIDQSRYKSPDPTHNDYLISSFVWKFFITNQQWFSSSEVKHQLSFASHATTNPNCRAWLWRLELRVDLYKLYKFGKNYGQCTDLGSLIGNS